MRYENCGIFMMVLLSGWACAWLLQFLSAGLNHQPSAVSRILAAYRLTLNERNRSAVADDVAWFPLSSSLPTRYLHRASRPKRSS